MVSSYPIKVWSGLLSNGHTQKIENALWEFIWLVNKVTKEEDGIGYVLRGIPVRIDDIRNDLKRSYQSVYRHLQQLKKYGYINIKKAPYGIIVTINNSKKFIKNDTRLIKNDKTKTESFTKIDKSFIKNDTRLIKNDKANKIIKDTKDINNIYIELLNFWNSKEIIVHKQTDELLESIEKTIKKKKLKEDNIKKGIENYNTALKDKEYFFKYIWSLENFLSQKKALSSFLEGGESWENYKAYREAGKGGDNIAKRFATEREYTDKEWGDIESKFVRKEM